MKLDRENKFLIIVAVFVATLGFLPLISAKIVSVFGLTFSVSAFFYAITFPCTDLISECWGKERAKKVVWMGFLAILLATVSVKIAVLIPPADFWLTNQEAYALTFSLVPRIVLAGAVSYLVSQRYDVWAFHWWRKRTSNKYLWLRNNASTMASQFIDTAIFITVAFIGTMPLSVFLQVLFAQYIVKVAIAAIDTPFIYWLRDWIGVPQELVARHQKGTSS